MYDVEVLGSYDTSLQNDLIGDVDRIQQVLLNLTSNAAKFVPKAGGIIRISASLRNA